MFAGAVWGVLAATALAGEPVRVEPDFSPPPVPDFMLRKPDKPPSIDEMRRQADAAAARVRTQRDLPPSPPAVDVQPQPGTPHRDELTR